MSIYAVVADGEVINTIEWDGVSDYKPESGDLIQIPEDINAGVGWTHNGNEFIPPPGFIASEQLKE
ncbi:hypothetical protein WMR55_003577 [Escherichia coli]|nr:hypothetical protein [Escherichia coli]